MSKKALAEEIVRSNPKMSETEAVRSIDAVVNGITTMVKRGESVVLNGFGKFEKKHQGERQGRNVRTNEPIRVSARDVLKFKATVKV